MSPTRLSQDSGNVDLSDLTIFDGNAKAKRCLNPSFDASETRYSIAVENGVDEILVN